MAIFLHRLVVATFLTFSLQAASQVSEQVKTLEQDYFDFFELNRETVFLHLNKTTLIPGEDLWLSAYIYNTKTELPNPETTNLRVGIYDEQGNHLRTHTVFVLGGKGSSMFPIDAAVFPPGTYYLKASTRFMDNFREDLSYIQPFTIVGRTKQLPEREVLYDLQLLPEGGHLVTGSINSVGVKMIDQNGFGAAFSKGIIVDSAGTEITSFHSNKFGMSRLFFTPLPQMEYKAIITTVDGREIVKEIPAARKTGINLVTTLRDDHFLVSLRTNRNTYPELADKPFLFTIHKDGKLRDFEFRFPEDELEVNIIMHKDSLFPGANTLTIFDDGLNPILERMIFNEKNLKRERITTSIKNSREDSISLQLESRLQSGSSLSVSVLPGETKSYDPAHDILSAFYLKPHLKGAIDEPLYYFSPGDENRKRYDLDLLLLTQGWSRYDWSNPSGNHVEELHEHEIGFTITGKVQRRNERRQNTLFIGSEDLFEIADIMEDGSFRMDKVFLTDSTELSFGLMDGKTSKLTKPALTATVIPGKEAEQQGEPLVTSRRFYYASSDAVPRTYSTGFDELDTVVINSKKHMFIPDLQIYEKGIEITEEIARRYHNIADFIATQGFQVRYVQGELEIKSLRLSKIPKPASQRHGQFRRASSNVMLYFNGVPVGTDPSFINTMPTSEVESIIVNKMGYGYGGQGVNGVIHINTKQGGYVADRTERVLSILSNNGYTPDKEFYTPNYVARNTAAYNRFATVNWIPNLQLDEDGKASFSLEKGQSFKLFIQGMGADGSLISEEFVINNRR